VGRTGDKAAGTGRRSAAKAPNNDLPLRRPCGRRATERSESHDRSLVKRGDEA